jgi:hypothetical protein
MLENILFTKGKFNESICLTMGELPSNRICLPG